MRKELLEYGYDYMLWTMFKSARRALGGSPKEVNAMFKVLPEWKEPLSLLSSVGDAGRLLVGAMEQWMEDVITAHQKGKKLVLTTFCFPVGVLRAFDCVPLNMEIMTAYGNILWKRGVFDFYDYCTELGMTDTSCAGQRGAMGAYLAGAGETPDFVLINSPGFCDSNANSFQFYASYKNVPIYAQDCPPELTGERARAYHRQDFRNMMKFLEEQTGKKPNWDFLREVAAEIKKQDQIMDEILSLVSQVPCPVPGFATAMIYSVKLAFSGFKEATPVLEEILRVSKENYKAGRAGTSSGKERARIFPYYIDHFTQGLKYWGFLDRYDLSHLGSILNFYWNQGTPFDKGNAGETYSMDLTSEDAIIDSMADQLARMPMVKQIIGPYRNTTQWLEDTISAARINKADCLVYCGTFGCRNTWAIVKPIAMDTEKAGLPTYVLVADVFDDRVTSWETCENRLLEFLKIRKIID